MRMKSILIIIILFSFTSCLKEIGEKKYNLVMSFSSGDTYTISDVIYEKDKKYSYNGSAEELMKGYDNNMILFGVNRRFYYTDNKYLVGRIYDQLSISNCGFANGQDIITEGSISLEGKYKGAFRKIKVEEGNFTLHWGNSEDYGITDSIITGTWTLKRV